MSHPWSGNVRELRNAVERVVLLHDGPLIEAGHLSFLEAQRPVAARMGQAGDMQGTLMGMSLDDLNKKLIMQALEQTNGNRTKAAKLLGMSRPTMVYRIEKYGIQVPEKD